MPGNAGIQPGEVDELREAILEQHGEPMPIIHDTYALATHATLPEQRKFRRVVETPHPHGAIASGRTERIGR